MPPSPPVVQVSPRDRDILRHLAEEIAAIARLPVHREKADLWRRLNHLEKTRPLVWINEIPWHEMNVNDELTLRCEGEWTRVIESGFRMMLYQWRHLPGDMIVSDYFTAPLAIRSSGIGMTQQGQLLHSDAKHEGVVSQHFIPQIVEPKDIEKIKTPVVTHDKARSAEVLEAMTKLFGDVLPVRQVGIKHIWFTPWDYLIRFWGVQQAMIDLVERPEMVNAAVSRFVDAMLAELDQYENLNLLALNNDNTRIGSGGYGYTDEFPGKKYDPTHVRPHNMWGCSNAQIFSEVSPDMHWEFALKHDVPWLKRWGLTYYGCCEPLHLKLGILKRIPNLRKVSMSTWVKVDRAVAEMGDRYVFSYKPNPAILAEDDWHPGRAREELVRVLDQARGCRVEIILKDISTVRGKPQRLWEWEKLAMETAEKYEG